MAPMPEEDEAWRPQQPVSPEHLHRLWRGGSFVDAQADEPFAQELGDFFVGVRHGTHLCTAVSTRVEEVDQDRLLCAPRLRLRFCHRRISWPSFSLCWEW